MVPRNSFNAFILLIVTYVAQQSAENALMCFHGNSCYANTRQYYKYIAYLVDIILPSMSGSSKWLEVCVLFVLIVCCNSMLGLKVTAVTVCATCFVMRKSALSCERWLS